MTREEKADYQRAYRAGNRERIAARKALRKLEIAEVYRRWTSGNPWALLLRNARARSRKLGLPCDLTREDVVVPERCPILGLRLEHGKGKPHAASPSLDRIDPHKGYVRGNVQVISHRANTMKQDASASELRAFSNWIQETFKCA